MAEDHDFVVVNASDAQDPQPPPVLAKIQAWLSPTDFCSDSSDYNKHLRSYLPSTGDWLRKSSQFKQWHQSGDRALWINGIPGSGKSVVAASLAEQFALGEDVPTLFFFFRHANLANRNPRQMTRDWLSQLLGHSPVLQLRLKSLTEVCRQQDDVSFDELWRLFRMAAGAMPKVYCVADALDEMESGHEEFLSELVALGQGNASVLKLLLTSRRTPLIEGVFEEPATIAIHLDRRLVDQDILTFIDHCLDHRVPIDISSDEREAIKETVRSKADGLFLYAKLSMEEVQRNIGSKPTQEILAGLPSGMDSMYTSLLYEHSLRSGVCKELQSLILQLVTHASRPLRLLEIAEVVRSTEHARQFVSVSGTKGIIRTACGPLLTLLPDESMQVIHHSFTEYLVDGQRPNEFMIADVLPAFNSSAVHHDLAIICIRYILSCCAKQNESGKNNRGQFANTFDNNAQDSMALQYPFLRYATQNWMHHVVKTQSNDLLLQTMDRLLDPRAETFLFWQTFWRGTSHTLLQPLHVVSSTGLCPYVKRLCESGTEIDCMSSEGRTPLSYACEHAHTSVVLVLLEYGASVDTPSNFGVQPIHYATRSDHVETVRSLLQAQASPVAQMPDPKDRCIEYWQGQFRTQMSFGDSPLQYVCAHGKDSILMEMLNYASREDLEQGPFQAAAEHGQTATVALLLGTGRVDPNASDRKGRTPLCLAAHGNSTSTVRILLRAGADIHKSSRCVDRYHFETNKLRSEDDDHEVSPLHAWACNSYSDVNTEEYTGTAVALLAAGCDVNCRDANGRSPIFYWSRNQDPEKSSALIKTLVGYGADVTMTDIFENTPLHIMSYRSNSTTIKALVDAGADVNAHRSSDGQTPLMCAINEEDSSVPPDWSQWPDLYHVEPNAVDANGRTVLHSILMGNKWDIASVKQWLKAGADPTIKDYTGQTCISNLLKPVTYKGDNTAKDQEIMLRALQAAGLDLNDRDHRGRTVALEEGKNWNLEALKTLQQCGSDLRMRDFEGKSALHILAERGMCASERDYAEQISCMKFLIEAGIDPNGQDYSGNTALHIAVENSGPLAAVIEFHLRAVADLDLDVKTQNHQGRTVLHNICTLPSGAQIENNYSGECEAKLEPRIDHLLAPRLDLDVNHADHDGITPIHLAATLSAIRVKKLLQAGADFASVDHQGRSALHYAARARNSNVVGLLVGLHRTNMLSLDRRDRNGRTALHDAVRAGVPESVYILLEQGADPQIRDFQRKSAMDMISEISEEQEIWKLYRSFQSSCAPEARWHRTTQKTELGYSFSLVGLKLIEPSQSLPPIIDHIGIATGEKILVGDVERTEEVVRLLSTSYSTPVKNDTRRQEMRKKSDLVVLPDVDLVGMNQEVQGEDRILHQAVLSGQISLISLMLDRLKQKERELPAGLLHAACHRTQPNLEMIKFLVRQGVDLNAKQITGEFQENGMTAMHLLAKSHHWWQPQALQYLLEVGADPEITTENGKTVLQIAIKGRSNNHQHPGFWRQEAVAALLIHGAKVNYIDPMGRTPLIEAFAEGPDIVKILVSNGANIELGTPSPISQALLVSDSTLIEILLEAGVSPNAICEKTDIHPWVPQGPLLLHAACGPKEKREQARSTIDLLLRRGAKPDVLLDDGTPLLTSIIIQGGLFEPFLSIDLDLELRDPSGRTALLAACRSDVVNRSVETCKQFIDAGSDVLAVDNRGMTCLHYLCGNVSWWFESLALTMSTFLEHGALINALDAGGRSPLHYSCKSSRPSAELIQFLLDAGADANEPYPDENGRTLLHLLVPHQAEVGYLSNTKPIYSVVQRLIEAGLDPDARDLNGNTPIFGYVTVQPLYEEEDETVNVYPDLEDVRHVLRQYDVTARNDAGENLLHVVAKRSSCFSGNPCGRDDTRDMFQILLDMGLDAKAEDIRQRTPLDVAAACGNRGIIELFSVDE